MKKSVKIIFFILIFLIPSSKVMSDQFYDVVIAMCRPTVSQIKNIEWLYEKDLITYRRIKLLCIYHEEEKTDYKPSFTYVKKKKLSWVDFVCMKGMVRMEDLFRKNCWTKDFLKIFKNSNGIIFTGGMDIPPSIYKAESLFLTRAATPVRSYYEVSFMFHLIGGGQNPSWIPFLQQNKNYCVLGICLGAQTMNVAAGGTLYQDIPSEIYKQKTKEGILRMPIEKIHSSWPMHSLYPLENDIAPAFHPITFKKKGLFVKKMKFKREDKPLVLSSHHQAIKKLGKNLVVIATSRDGKIVEAISHAQYKRVLGVQFHPEHNNLFLKSKFFKKDPEGKVNFNLREYLIKNPPSMKFHRKIWEWFSDSLK